VGFPAFVILFIVIILSILECKVKIKGIFGRVAAITADADLVVVSIEEVANLFFVAHPIDIVFEHWVREEA
jgi:hypothetical protein